MNRSPIYIYWGHSTDLFALAKHYLTNRYKEASCLHLSCLGQTGAAPPKAHLLALDFHRYQRLIPLNTQPPGPLFQLTAGR